MATVQECVSEQQLRDYLLGRLDDQESELLEEHLRDCATCEDTAAQLEAEDTFAGYLRSLAEVEPPVEDEGFAASAERAKQMVPFSPQSSPEDESTGPAIGDGPLGSYELLERIGRGGMGAVYRGRHRRLDRIVAIKLLPSRFADDPEAIARFQREMLAVGRLHHQAIVTATDAGEYRGTHYLVMELVDGLDLARIARAMGPLPIGDACEVVRQAALGLEYAHSQGVVHRDIKPSNLMLDRQGRVKILDLGLAQLGPWKQPVDEFTTVGQLMGTLDYMAPEQAESGQPTDYRADLYSLGATLYRLLCGRAPYAVTPHLSPLEKLRLLASSEPPKLATLRPDAPLELCDLVDQLLSRAPADRPAGAATVAERLEPLSSGAAVVALLDRAQEHLANDPIEEEPRRTSALGLADVPPAAGKRKNHRGWRGMVATAAFLPLLFLAGVLVVLETQKGQVVIESDAANVQVRLVRDGEPVEDLSVQQGANTTRVRAGEYEVVIDQPSDELVVSDNTFTLRRGETIVTRITRRSPEDRTGAGPSIAMSDVPTSADSLNPTYDGKTLDEWLAILERERARDELEAAFRAIEVLADRESGQKAAKVILRVARQLPEDYYVGRTPIDRHAFYLVQMLLAPQAAMEEVFEQLAVDDPNWQRRVLSGIHRMMNVREYQGSLNPLVDRVAALALNQQHPSLSYTAIVQLLQLNLDQHQRGEWGGSAHEALERALEAMPAAEQFFAEFAIERSWPESLQWLFLQWSVEQVAADNVSDDVLTRAAANISVNIPLAAEISPDLPQAIAVQLARHTDPLPTLEDAYLVNRPFAEHAARLIAKPLKEAGVNIHPVFAEPGRIESGIRIPPALLLASLAGEPALRSEGAVRVLQKLSSELEPKFETERFDPDKWWVFLPSPRSDAGSRDDETQWWLYRISQWALENASSESTSAPTPH